MCTEDVIPSVDIDPNKRKGNKPTTCPKSALTAALPEKHRDDAGRLKTSPALRLAIPRPRIPSLPMVVAAVCMYVGVRRKYGGEGRWRSGERGWPPGLRRWVGRGV